MNPCRLLFCCGLFCLFANLASAQNGDIVAVDDSICIMAGDTLLYNVKSNDIFPPGFFSPVILTGPSDCFGLTPDGQLYFLAPASSCCGEHILKYRYEQCQPPNICSANIKIIVKCPKPDCFFVNLEDFIGNNGSAGNNPDHPDCVPACENSPATYYVTYNPADTYAWTVSGGSYTFGANPAEIIVNWGTAGSGSITLSVTNGNGQTNTAVICANILPSPVAGFQAAADSVCRNTPISFVNTSTGGSNFFWDFGDGNYSSMFEPTHQYAGPGTYTVTLIVTNSNFDPNGAPLCCCTDTATLEVVVDPLPGPNIYCVSTLCAGDSTHYWTDATGCGSYVWTVLDENGMAVTFGGQGTDTIGVHWGNGPVGTVSLQVTGCDSAYCDQPVSVLIPIISTLVNIAGPAVVCADESATYTVPKWLSVDYNWAVSGGAILSGMGTNTVVVHWGAGPGGTISVNYGSPFLGGLPGHEAGDCSGSGSLSVSVKPPFDVNGPPSVVCANSVSTFFATNSPYGNYTWAISPALSFTGQGTNSITVNWTGGPGTYVITAVPNDTTYYCNPIVTKTVTVVELVPPSGITGPAKICPGESYTYFGQTGQSGTGFTWMVTNGTPATFTGNPINVTWGPSGPYKLVLSQFYLGPPYCNSDTIQLNVQPKLLNGPITISGPPACINSIKNYTGGPAQDPDATYSWSITPASAGSVIKGQGTLNVQVQWNNSPGTATLKLTVNLCNSSLVGTLPLTLIAPAIPNITQIGTLCPGVPATLDAGAGFTAYAWSNLATTQTITITTPGTYVVTTTDANTCTAADSYTAVAAPGPTALISTASNTTLCINPPNNNTVTLIAVNGSGYTFAWYCNGVLQSLPPTQNTFVHTNTNVVGTFNYYVVVTAPGGCTAQSNTIVVVQANCNGGGAGCVPQTYNLAFSSVNQVPNCNIVDFTVTASGNVTLNSWNFGDPLSNTNSGTLANAEHTYATVGCTKAILFASVPEAAPGTGTCLVSTSGPVCIPLVANFSYSQNCQKVSFTDMSTYMTGQGPSSWLWNFGDSNTSTAQNPMHVYASGGNYTVTLTATNSSGCQAVITKVITVIGLPNPVVTALPNPACTGQPVAFTGTAANILSWLWNFGDGAANGSQNPSHTYLSAGNYNVSLAVVDILGCMDTAQILVTVNAGLAQDTIAYTPGLTACAGDSVKLTAPAGTGYTYLWSTNATTQSIFVSAAGSYSVTVTDANGCTMVPDSVVLTVYPLPSATIAGPAFICDAGCITLSAPGGYGYSYQWLDNTLNPLPGVISKNIQVCDYNLLPSYSVVVTDANGCSATSAPFTVTVAVSPAFSITVSPDSCEGTPATLTVVPTQPNVVYSWSNGGSGANITVVQAGVYTAIGTDTISGCKGTATATIHPLPNLCIVPAGCYEACNPDTICGPDGLSAYQWNLNGAPIAGATGQCLIVTQSGTYSLTGTTEFGCSLTSDSLMLELINCGCVGLDAWATPSETDSCCWNLNYANNYGDLYGLVIHTASTGLSFDLGTLNSALSVYAITGNSISLVNSQSGEPLPGDTLGNFIKMCFTGILDTPQVVIFDWYDFDFGIACSDTLIFHCPVEPDCLYLKSDSIYCDGTQVVYQFTVCNPVDAQFPVAYIVITPSSPAGIVVSPNTFSETTNPIQPGDCRTYTVLLSGTGIEHQQFCYSLTAHDSKPEPVDTSLCCMLDSMYCIEIPDCMPCDNVGVETVDTLSSENGNCCYAISLYNSYAAGYFDEIDVCMLTSGVTMTMNNPFGSGWVTTGYNPAMISLAVAPPIGTTLPVGVVTLPEICVRSTQAPPELLEIKWVKDGNIVCRDTVPLGCEPPCGYIFNEAVICDPTVGGWVFTGTIKNTSAFTMDVADFVFTDPAGLGAYNFALPLGGLPPGGTAPFSIVIGSPALSGDTVCFTVALHVVNDDALHTNCCNFHDCIVLPDCAEAASCNCNQAFIDKIDQGINIHSSLTSDLTFSFSPKALLDPCDAVSWTWSDAPNPDFTTGNAIVEHSFLSAGNQSVCMRVMRTTPDGVFCIRETCSEVNIQSTPTHNEISVFPNPSDGRLYAFLNTAWTNGVHFRVYDMLGRQVAEQQISDTAGKHVLPLQFDRLNTGVYLLTAENAGHLWKVKIMIQ